MKLFYRGTAYEYDFDRSKLGNTGRPARPAQTSQPPYMLRYRGTAYRVNPTLPKSEALASAPYDLIYRGTVYTVDRNAQGKVAIAARPAGTTRNKLSVPFTLPTRHVAKVHQSNLLDNLQHRLEVARQQNDQKLIQMLEAEQREISA